MTELISGTDKPAATGGAAQAPAPLFLTDAPRAPSLATYPALDLLADLAVHKHTQTPLTIALFGGPGAGKTHALSAFRDRIRGLAAEAEADDPFLDEIITVAVEARDLQPDAATGLAKALNEAFQGEGLQSAAARLDAIAIEAATDHHAAAHEASAKLRALRERIGAEQQHLEEAKTQRAGLNEDLLFGAAATRLDDYAKRNRKQLEASLKGFGFIGDVTAAYKALLRDFSARAARPSAFADSIWAYPGQVKLLVTALVFFLLAWGIGLAEQTRSDWLTLAESSAALANWIEAHAHWFTYLRRTAIAIGILCITRNIWRAIRFASFMAQGLRLLDEDASASRAELDRFIAQRSGLISKLNDEALKLAGHLEAIEARARQRGDARDKPFAPPMPNQQGPDAKAYLCAIAAGLATDDAPQRIIVMLDGLEALPAQQAAAVVEGAHHLLNHPSFVLALAADAEQLATGWGGAGEATQRLERYVQAPFNIRMIRSQQASIAYAHQLLGAAPTVEERPLDATTCAFDLPLKPIETHLLGKLASLAGETPRAVKRYLNCWRIARPLTNDSSALALMLALDHGGTSGELAAMGAAMDLEEPGKPLQIHPGEPRLAAALATLNSLRQAPLTIGQAHTAWTVARDYSIPSP